MHQMLLSLFLLFHFVIVSPQVIPHLKFASQWGPHYCLVNAKCIRNIPSEFTIHGIWPDGDPPPPPNGCNRPGLAYNPRRAFKLIVGELEGHLSRDWPDLSGRQTPEGQEFWKHEWNIHGTCSDNYYNQFQYFILAPKFRQHYHLRKILENGNIHCCMGYAYTAQHIQKAIFDSTGYYPDLRCQLAQLAGGNRLLLVEIIICLDIMNLQVIDCPYPSTSCIYYPRGRRRGRGCRPRPMSITY